MDIRNTIEDYLHCLERGDYDALMRLFTPDAVVYSPLYGRMPARDFYQRLLADTQASRITLLQVYTGETPGTAAAHFHYDWVLANGRQAPFEVVDLFECAPDGRIASLRIIYDTQHTRSAFEAI